MSNEYPLFPELPDEAANEAQELLNRFREAVRREAEEAVGEFYSDIMPYIESDTWMNFRRELLDGLCDYSNRKIQATYDFGRIRKAIYRKYKSEIVADLNQDLVKENNELKEQVERLLRRGIV